MAERLRDAPLPAMLVAGSFHARRDLGVPVHLRDLGAEKGAQVLMLVEAGQAVTTREADYAWYTPAQPDKDYCAEMKRHVEGRARGLEPCIALRFRGQKDPAKCRVETVISLMRR